MFGPNIVSPQIEVFGSSMYFNYCFSQLIYKVYLISGILENTFDLGHMELIPVIAKDTDLKLAVSVMEKASIQSGPKVDICRNRIYVVFKEYIDDIHNVCRTVLVYDELTREKNVFDNWSKDCNTDIFI